MERKEPTEEFYEGLRKLIKTSEGMYRQAETEFAPLVTFVIQSKCRDSQKIENLLDSLLSFASDERILILFKELCRYYYFINQEATSYYVNAYKEMWEEGGEENGLE
ncbi:hypothetical protein FACS1894174_10320 [Bacteroidia bacterium]|nr:hypothetical protein FACS1894155_04690 [Bacteroidia bacterium]GHV24210.1 hypothetical protein FACS1894174_10320 [Bacteroidia bacterium]